MNVPSIAHVTQSVLQYVALVIALLLYQWIEDRFKGPHRTLKAKIPRFYQHSRRGNGNQHNKCIRIVYQWSRHFRREHNLTQERFAELLHVDTTTVSRWENNGVKPQPNHIRAFRKLKHYMDETDVLISYRPTHPPLPMKRRPRLIPALVLLGILGLWIVLTLYILHFGFISH